MANRITFDNTISDVSPQAEPRPQLDVPTAPVDTSSAEDIALVGGLAIEAGKGLALSSFERELTDVNKQHLTALQNNLSKLNSGVTQGVLNTTEFNVKKQNLLKGYLNTFPGLTSEIKQIASTNDMSGTASAFNTLTNKMFTQQMKMQGEMADRVREADKAVGLSLISPTATDEEAIAIWQQVEPIINSRVNNIAGLEGKKSSGAWSVRDTRSAVNLYAGNAIPRMETIIRAGFQQAGADLPYESDTTFLQYIQNVPQEEAEALKPFIKNLFESDLNRVIRPWNELGHMSSTDFNNSIAPIVELYEEVEESLTNESIRKRVEDKFKIMQNRVALELASESDAMAAVLAMAGVGVTRFPTSLNEMLGKDVLTLSQSGRLRAFYSGDKNKYTGVTDPNDDKVGDQVVDDFGKAVVKASDQKFKNMKPNERNALLESYTSWMEAMDIDNDLTNMSKIKSMLNSIAPAYKEIEAVDPEKAGRIKEALNNSFNRNLERMTRGVEKYWNSEVFEIIPPTTSNPQLSFKIKEGAQLRTTTKENQKNLSSIFSLLNQSANVSSVVNGSNKFSDINIISGALNRSTADINIPLERATIPQGELEGGSLFGEPEEVLPGDEVEGAGGDTAIVEKFLAEPLHKSLNPKEAAKKLINLLSPREAGAAELEDIAKADSVVQETPLPPRTDQGRAQVVAPPDIDPNVIQEDMLDKIFKGEVDTLDGEGFLATDPKTALSKTPEDRTVIEDLMIFENDKQKGFKGGKWLPIPSTGKRKSTHQEIGYGIEVTNEEADQIRKDGGLDQTQLMKLFIGRIREASKDAADVIPGFNQMSVIRKRVFINMAYQLGRTGLSKFKKMRLALQDIDKFGEAAVVKEMLDSKWAKEDSPERALALVQMFIKGDK